MCPIFFIGAAGIMCPHVCFYCDKGEPGNTYSKIYSHRVLPVFFYTFCVPGLLGAARRVHSLVQYV